MKPPQLLTRDHFREGVFQRDGYKCVMCGSPAADAHHIIERRLFPDGGYYLENGASVCGEHHIMAEQTLISCDELRQKCNITQLVIPPHLYRDQEIDKWGNPVLPNGNRLRGDLFYDESVQKILEPVMHLFSKYVKYPRTFHLPWSPGADDKNERVMLDTSQFIGKQVVVTEKMDGECCTGGTKISMANSTTLSLSDVVNSNMVGQLALGMDTNGNVIPSRILRVFKNGSTEDWLRIRIGGKRRKDLFVTPNHLFFVPNKNAYVEAQNLIVGEKILTVNSTLDLTTFQEQVLLGKLLGDGALKILPSVKYGHTQIANVQISHKNSCYKPWLLESPIVGLEKKTHRVDRIKYDIETETHNYFANGVLVHNCTSMYNDHIHARSMDTLDPHPSRSRVKALWASICSDIPEGWRLSVENLFAKHSIHYLNLQDHAVLFAIWDDRNVCRSWSETKEWGELLGLTMCPVLYEGTYNEELIKRLHKSIRNGDECEGYVIRTVDSFPYGEFRKWVGKYVGKNFLIDNSKHWKSKMITLNEISSKP